MIWTGKMIAEQIIQEGTPVKINPSGVDLKPLEVWKIPSDAKVFIHGKERTMSPEKVKVDPVDGFYILGSGVYEVRLDAKVKIPQNAIGLCLPRSTMNRFGCIKGETAVWDPGYEGYGTSTIMVTVDEFKIHKDEAWFQFIMNGAHEADDKYDGHWQNEGS